MKNEDLLRIQAYLDGELTPEESRSAEVWLQSYPDAQKVLSELRQTNRLLAGNELSATLPETREFYWSKIEREISRHEAKKDVDDAPVLARWWVRFLLPSAGVAILILLALFFAKPLVTGQLASYFHEIETPLEEASAISFHSQAAAMTVVWIDSEANVAGPGE